MSGGRSPPRKDARTKGAFLDDVDDPHGEMRRHECLQAVEKEKLKRVMEHRRASGEDLCCDRGNLLGALSNPGRDNI